MPRDLHASFMKPFVALATPGMYLVYKYNQFKRQQQEQNKRKVTERELQHLNHKIDKLLAKLDEHEPELATSQDEECVVCISAKASMQTYPCGHKVVCRKCFVKTIQMAVSQRLLPLRCVICRAKILRLKQSSGGSSSSSITSSCSSRSMSQSNSNSSHLSTCSSITSTSSSTSSTSSTSVNVPHGGVSQRHKMVNTTSKLSYRDKSQHFPLQQSQQQHVNTVAISSIRKSVVLPNNCKCVQPARDSVSNKAAQTSQTKNSDQEISQRTSYIISTRQAAIDINDYLVPSPDILYFKPSKDKVGSRKNFLRPSHKSPSLPKVSVRSKSSLKMQKRFETILE